jgi:hypothetical protein
MHMSTGPARLEDRIQELCARALAIRGGDELTPILTELRSAIPEYVRRPGQSGQPLVTVQIFRPDWRMMQ